MSRHHPPRTTTARRPTASQRRGMAFLLAIPPEDVTAQQVQENARTLRAFQTDPFDVQHDAAGIPVSPLTPPGFDAMFEPLPESDVIEVEENREIPELEGRKPLPRAGECDDCGAMVFWRGCTLVDSAGVSMCHLSDTGFHR